VRTVKHHSKIHFPFSAIVGMENAKLALMVNAVNPLIGGVVLAGDKGTGKSTLVRAFAQVLPEQPVAKGCPFNCNPFNPLEMCDVHYDLWSKEERIEYESRKIRVVDLPLNATPDRVAGSIDIEQTIKTGRVAFKPGLLAEANRQVLYIDEVNLLEDYIADLILDAAASGWNVVEREGVSFKHPARFVLVGSMNPEEGMLRPQILDRFGLYIPVEASMDPEERAEIVARVDEFARDPESFYERWEPSEKQIEERIAKARGMVNDVAMDRDLLKLVTTTVVKLGIKTHRAEVVTVRTAKAIAALDGRTRVELSDVTKAMELALRHRLKSRPFEEPQRKFDEVIKELTGERPEPEKGQREGNREASPRPSSGFGAIGSGRSDRIEAHLKDFSEASIDLDRGPSDDFGAWGRASGRGSRNFKTTAIASFKGVPIDAIPPLEQRLVDVDLPATLRASVASSPVAPIVINPSCIRVRVRKERIPAFHAILLDASGSMLAQKKVSIAKRVLKSLVEEAYVNRTYASLIVFRGEEATTVAGPTRNLDFVYEGLEKVPIGGSTPFTLALLTALDHFKAFRRVYKSSKLSLHIISDGAANVFLTESPRREVLDLAEEYKRLGVEVIAYHAASRLTRATPDYLGLFVESAGGKRYSVRQTIQGVTTGLNSSNKLHT
jgi:magnesium chelatase subunit D